MPDPVRLPYQLITDPTGGRLLRPIISIDLTYTTRHITADALIDSGADANVLPYQLGIDLGADWNRAKPVPALSGNLEQAEARATALDVTIPPFTPVRMVFVWVRTDAARLLLGQINFIQEFHICFFGAEGYFEIRSKNDVP